MATPDVGQASRALRIFSAQDAERTLVPVDGDQANENPDSVALLVFLGRLIHELAAARIAGRTDRDRTVAGFLNELKQVPRLDLGWTDELFAAIPSGVHLSAALNLVLKVWKAEKVAKSLLSRLPLQAWAERLCCLGASPALAERRGLVEPGTLKRSLVPLRVAARQAGLTDMHLYHLMLRAEVAPMRTLEVGARQHLFSAEQVEGLKRFRHQGNGYGNSLDLGLEATSLNVLRGSGILSLVQGGYGRTWLDGGELRMLLNVLAGRAVPLPSLDGLKLSLGSSHIWRRRYLPGLKTLFDRLRSGEVPVWSFGNRPGFGRFYVGVDALEFLHRSVPAWARPVDDVSQMTFELTGGMTSWSPLPAGMRTVFSQPRRPKKARCAQLSLELA